MTSCYEGAIIVLNIYASAFSTPHTVPILFDIGHLENRDLGCENSSIFVINYYYFLKSIYICWIKHL